MTSHPSPLADRFAGLRAALEERPGELRPASAAALDAMLLALLASLLGRLERLARLWHPAAPQEDSEQEEYAPLFPHNLLYLLGPRRNRGMRPHARTTPLTQPRTARAPPPGHNLRIRNKLQNVANGTPHATPSTPSSSRRAHSPIRMRNANGQPGLSPGVPQRG
jgi:hypothetical protein